MATPPDPKEIKILSDILALVLEDNPGTAQNALNALRNRAQRNGTTAGALKNLFNSLASDPNRIQGADREARLRQTITRLERDAKTHQTQIKRLEFTLSQHQSDDYAMRAMREAHRQQNTWQYLGIGCGLIVGLLFGIAMTQFYHTMTDRPPIDRSTYFR